MKTFITTLLLLLPVLSFSQVKTYKNQDGVSVNYTNFSSLKFDLLLHISVRYGLVKLNDENQSYAIFIISNYINPTVSADKKILFRLENNEVITCPAMRSYDENDRFEAQNANSSAANQKYLQAYFTISEDDLVKINTSQIIKMRVEFDQQNLDSDEKKCKDITKTIRNSYDALKLSNFSSDEF